jgi:SulP family sulfate permease
MKKRFDLHHIKGDLFGGITAGIVALPLALAFGVSSGLGAVAGIYGAIFVSFFAAFFGGTNTQISGPTAPMTAISMVVIANVLSANDGDLSKALPIILTIFLIAGILQISLGLLGVGKYVKYVPYSVISGFMSAIGIMIIATQLLSSTGYEPAKDKEFVAQFKSEAEEVLLMKMLEKASQEDHLDITKLTEVSSHTSKISEKDIYTEAKNIAKRASSGVIGTIKAFPRAVQQINLTEFMMVLGTLILFFGFKEITTKIPSSLLAIIVVSSIALIFDLDYKSIQKIPAGLPDANLKIFTEFKLSTLTPYLSSAIMLALLGAIDSLLTSVVADNLSKTKHQPNKELIGQGIGNSIAAFFGGIPGAGTTVTTVVNIKAGGRTILSGMITGIFLLLIVFFLSPYASKIPMAVLSGILITVGISVIDFKGIKVIFHIPKGEVLILVTVFLLSSLWNLVYAVAIGLVIASFIFVKKIGDLTEKKSELTQLKEKSDRLDSVEIAEELRKNIYIIEVEGALFFGSTNSFNQLLIKVPENSKTIIIDMHKMQYLGLSGIYVLEDFVEILFEKGKEVMFVGVQDQPEQLMKKVKIIPRLISSHLLFHKTRDCVAYLKTRD